MATVMAGAGRYPSTYASQRTQISPDHADYQEPMIDMSNEYTCFLCNGYQTVIGSIRLDSVGIILTNAIGVVLERNPYDAVVSVNEIEPADLHTLIIVFPERYVMLSHLLRKSKLVETFKNVGLYQEEPKLPPEAVGFYDPNLLNELADEPKAVESNPSSMYGLSVGSSTGRPVAPSTGRPVAPSTKRTTPHVRGRSTRERDMDRWSNERSSRNHQDIDQSILNTLQVFSSADQQRKNIISGDWMQLEKYPSTLNYNNKNNTTTTTTTPDNTVTSINSTT